jgi:LmbE family N-acetylglucosaminyl deacetylase
MTRKAYFAAAFILCLFLGQALAAETEELPAFTASDRVLVLAPHPDDETVAAGGAIMKARAAGASVRVVCLTNGDHNELAFIVYEKRLTIRKGEFLHMGEVRRKETLAAMASLGVEDKDVIFLGYPDYGTLSILLKYWGEIRPYRSILTRISKVSYPEAMSPGSPYVGESILRDIKAVLRDFKPTKIFVSNPSETNPDHMSFYLFTRIALWDVKSEIGEPQVFPYILHVVGWPKPRGYHPELELNTPPEANFSGMRWWKLELSPAEEAAKHKAISFFKSQIAYNPPYLFTFDRKNELFGDYPPIDLRPSFGGDFAWQDVGQPSQPASQDAAAQRPALSDAPARAAAQGKNEIAHLGFAKKNGNLYVRLNLTRNFQKDLGINIFLLGYNQNTDFATLPKLSVSIGLLGMRILDRTKVMFVKGAKFSIKKQQVIVTIPLACLGNPDYVLCRALTRFPNEYPFMVPGWRVINVHPPWKDS